jgi:hypothetical protein
MEGWSAFSIFGGSEKDIVAFHILHYLNARDAINMMLVCKMWYAACLKQKDYWIKQRKRIRNQLVLDTSWGKDIVCQSLSDWGKGQGLKPFYETTSIRMMSNYALFRMLWQGRRMWLFERICSCYYQVPYRNISCFPISGTNLNEGRVESFDVRVRHYLQQGGIEELDDLKFCLFDNTNLEIYSKTNAAAISMDQFFVPFEEWIVE